MEQTHESHATGLVPDMRLHSVASTWAMWAKWVIRRVLRMHIVFDRDIQYVTSIDNRSYVIYRQIQNNQGTKHSNFLGQSESYRCMLDG